MTPCSGRERLGRPWWSLVVVERAQQISVFACRRGSRDVSVRRVGIALHPPHLAVKVALESIRSSCGAASSKRACAKPDSVEPRGDALCSVIACLEGSVTVHRFRVEYRARSRCSKLDSAIATLNTLGVGSLDKIGEPARRPCESRARRATGVGDELIEMLDDASRTALECGEMSRSFRRLPRDGRQPTGASPRQGAIIGRPASF